MLLSDASAAALPEERGSGAGSGRWWRGVPVALDLTFAGIVGVAVLQAAVGSVEGSRPAVLAALAVWVVGYALLGAPAVRTGHPARSVGYLVVLLAVIGVIAWHEPSLLFVMFVAYPQVWFVVGRVRAGVLWTLGLALAATSGPFLAWTRGEEPLWGPGQTLIGLALSLATGLWVARVLQESERRAGLIRELERTRAELSAAEHDRGVLAERERLAREVHDTLAQGYTSIVVLSQTAAAQLTSDVEGARERLALIEEVARDNLAEARAVVAAFAPVALEDSTLVEALERLAARFARETGLAVRVDTAALGVAVALRRDEEVVLLRGAQEALTNVRRHANARSVVVRLSVTGAAEQRAVAVHVEDDGVGFDPASALGSGLEGLRGRVAQVGGAVDVASAPGEGTRVTLRVPAGEP